MPFFGTKALAWRLPHENSELLFFFKWCQSFFQHVRPSCKNLGKTLTTNFFFGGSDVVSNWLESVPFWTYKRSSGKTWHFLASDHSFDAPFTENKSLNIPENYVRASSDISDHGVKLRANPQQPIIFWSRPFLPNWFESVRFWVIFSLKIERFLEFCFQHAWAPGLLPLKFCQHTNFAINQIRRFPTMPLSISRKPTPYPSRKGTRMRR